MSLKRGCYNVTSKMQYSIYRETYTHRKYIVKSLTYRKRKKVCNIVTWAKKHRWHKEKSGYKNGYKACNSCNNLHETGHDVRRKTEMNEIKIIGNLTHDVELRTTQNGNKLVTLRIAVNKRKAGTNEQGDADFFDATVWGAMAENCAKYLSKGKKVYVSGPIELQTFVRKDGTQGARMCITARDVEFLSPYGVGASGTIEQRTTQTVIPDSEPLPF